MTENLAARRRAASAAATRPLTGGRPSPAEELRRLADHVDALLDVAPLRILESLPHKQRVAVQTNNITGHWTAARSGLGISRFASIGGQSDVRAAEILDSLVDDPDTSQVALYLESFTGGATLVSALKALRAAGKPTMIRAGRDG